MPHAESSIVPQSIATKVEFWEHVYLQLEGLLEGQRSWVTNLANASSLIYNSLLAFSPHFGKDEKAVNWCGFYLDSNLFPAPRTRKGSDPVDHGMKRLLLGPFCGKPACQFINIFPKPRGVCADAFIQKQTLLVPEVDLYPGHIACDGGTKSEIVLPLIHNTEVLGVLDLDCLAINGFNAEDKSGLEKVARLIVSACDW